MANIIYAKFSFDTASKNVLDPDTWIGGVVPGKDDVARFWYAYQTTYESSKFNIGYGQRDGFGRYGRKIGSHQWINKHGNEFTYTSSKFIPFLSQYKDNENLTNASFFTSTNDLKNTAAWKAYYQHLNAGQIYYGPHRYKTYAKSFRCNGGSTSITLDGVTYAETDTTTYDTRQKMCARIVELIKAGTLDQNKYTIRGPHNGTGVTNNTGHRQTTYNGAYFSIAFDTGSNKAPYGSADSLATGWYSGASNITIADVSTRWGPIRAYFTSSNAGLVYETSSFKFGVAYDYSSGSGYFYAPEQWVNKKSAAGVCVGPGTIGNFKVNFRDMSAYGYFHTASIDTSYATPVTDSPFIEYPCDDIYTNRDTMPAKFKKISPVLVDSPYITSDKLLQRYHISGSDHWNVGRIEMGDYNHFWIKDDAKITLHDLQDGTYYPSIDLTDLGPNSTTLLITDQATIEVSSSRTSTPAEAGIWNRSTTAIQVLISGSANYSSSYAPSSSKSGDTTIQISDLSNRFGVGDYVTIESSGSWRVTNAHWKDLSATTHFDSSSLTTGSYKEIMYSGAVSGYGSANNQHSALLVSESIDFTVTETSNTFTHNIQNDEVFQIVTMSGDYATVGKRFGKEGEINHDLGIYSRTAFINTFNETPDIYSGTKRVVLVDSNHKNFAKNDQLLINNKAYKVLHAGSHLTQSRFYDFTQGTTKASDVFVMRDSQRSGSNWSYTFGSYGISTSAYFAESYLRNRSLITGSNEQYIDRFPTAINKSLSSNAYNSSNYTGKRYYNANNYTALRLDPTVCYTWRNNTHKIQSTNYLAGDYHIKDLFWDEGEIVVSGSLIRDGHGDTTSSIGFDPANTFGILWGQTTNTSGAEYQIGTSPRVTKYPSPYGRSTSLSGYYGAPALVVNAGVTYYNEIPLGRHGETQYQTAGSGEGTRYLYAKLGATDHADAIGNLDVDHVIQNQNTGSAHIKLSINKGMARVSVGIKDKETELAKFPDDSGKSMVGVSLIKYASIHSIDIKSRYQMLILDTQDSFTYRDKIKEGGLLENHTPNKKVKYQGTEVTNPMAFTNLAIDMYKNHGSSSIHPYTYAVCRSGTNSDFTYHEARYGGSYPYKSHAPNNNSHFGQGQASANYYTIIDLGAEVEFDTISMQFLHPSYGNEYYINNKMNDVRFEVTNDPGLTDPWTPVRALEDDVREYAGRGAPRYYTFASGSVSARYIKYHSRGGTRYSSGYPFRNFAIYNMSASCVPGTAPAYNNIRDEYGGPTGSICQIELANTKNFSVGDRIFFQPKYQSTNSNWDAYVSYRNVYSTTNGLTDPLPENAIIGGYTGTYKIMNINGNVITLDRTPHIMMDRPMIALKKNRGNIKLHSRSPNTPFPFYMYTYNPMQLHVSHVDFNDAFIYCSGDQDNGPYQYWSDIGLSQRSQAYAICYLGAGGGIFARNIVSDARLQFLYLNSNNVRTNDSSLFFNMVTDLSVYVPNLPVTERGRHIENFNVLNWCITAPVAQYSGNVNFVPRLPKIVIKKNQFENGSRYPGELGLGGAPALFYRSLSNEFYDRFQLGPYFRDPSFDLNKYQTNVVYYGQYTKPMSAKRIKLLPHARNSFGFTNLNSMVTGPWDRAAGDISAFNRERRGGVNNTFGPDPVFQSGKSNPRYGGMDHVVIGNYYQKTVLAKNGDEYELYGAGTTNFDRYSNNYSDAFLTCIFEVFETTDVRFDFDLLYKATVQKLYGKGSAGQIQLYSTPISPDHIVLSDADGKVIDALHCTNFNYETISHRKIHSLKPGPYYIRFQMAGAHGMADGYHRMTIKNIDLKLVTADLSKVKIYFSNFNILDYFDEKKHKHVAAADNTATLAGGKYKVLKQSSDLGGTTNYKFNNIKL
jgi:hypothetical protein